MIANCHVTGKRFARLAALVSMVLIGFNCAIAAAGTPRVRHMLRPGSSGYGHLYAVSDNNGKGGVVAFPFDVNGLPGTSPSGTLAGGLVEPISLGFDGAGYMYVSDGSVKVYAPGASGNDQPVRSISVPAEPFWLAVDASGYVYVVAGFTSIEVFAPGAGPSSSPINTIPISSDYLMGLAIDAAGTIYAPGLFGIYIYKDPQHEQGPDRTLHIPEQNVGPVAVDNEQGRFYYRQEATIYDPWQAGEFGALNVNLSPIRIPRASEWVFQSNKCYDGGSSGTLIGGLAVNTNYLMYTCLPTSSVLVYNNAPGRQRRFVESLSVNLTLTGMAIGP